MWIYIQIHCKQSASIHQRFIRMRRTVTLVVVRHKQATHNLPTIKVEDMVMTTDEQKPIMNSLLTEVGRRQADLVANRLATTAFDLAVL